MAIFESLDVLQFMLFKKQSVKVKYSKQIRKSMGSSLLMPVVFYRGKSTN